ncbi:glycosyltransferase family 2 protein [Mycobacterium senriense]|uniref:glycosyltransferase family 2 protein n=1 Tax=Mycobacterium senriense TaxID=2775496 RepID=UPI0024DF2E5A|nr:glycosyltransferase family 2 protein [Mycobacterium senriense]
MESTNFSAEDPQAPPRISVCVPMHNNSSTIERCLRSILEQEADFEILVVDDQSSDDCVAIARSLLRPGDRLVRNQSRVGAARNHNKCIELARGECIQFVHGDDYLLPGALQTLAECFDDPAVGLAFAPRRVVTDDELWLERSGTLHNRFRRLEARNEGASLAKQMTLQGLGTNWVGEPTNVMLRRRLTIDAGGFRDDIVNLSDLDLWLRLMLRSAICFVPKELSVRHHTPFTLHALTMRPWWLDRLRIITWLVVDPASPTSIRVISALWWLPVWAVRALEVLIYGPDRWPRSKILAAAPYREFVRARGFRAELKGNEPPPNGSRA